MITEAIVWIIAILLGITSIIMSVLNRKRFKDICLLYKEKYGDLPEVVKVFDNMNTFYVNFAYSIKMQFIFKPLLRKKSSNFTKNDDKDFIRELPKRLIGPFYLELYLTLASLAFFIIAVILILVITYGRN
ncbi:hypothetical protein [Pseudescherichia sp.]|uniref:hypothetical protein n=1 Tax=Pseudescherichia sp. TaxID=2055881 RepID=UPI00289A1360|nr:hypothetical protein [Pseudescherichia sp.]